MPEASAAVPVPVRHTFFHTATASSSRPVEHLAHPDESMPAPDTAPQPTATNVFNPGLETLVESIMRLSVTDTAPVNNDIDEA